MKYGYFYIKVTLVISRCSFSIFSVFLAECRLILEENQVRLYMEKICVSVIVKSEN
ncbi:hypothetical protein FAJ36_07420 [Streptococcus suis]|uniref:Uncharacterized protein n=1 Tax=Streptococcus suis TaxID=1307 RepID=A0A4T2GZ77_STRSU|nr:hypothetical protein FAJ36_07420 [Streptococcus suis]